jgi:HEAT repeat protein
MKRSRARLGFTIVLIVSVCGVAGFTLRENLWPDVSSEAQLYKLSGFWVSGRRAAATALADFPGESDKVVPALVKALGDSDTEVRLNTLAALKAFGEKSKAATPKLKDLIRQDSDPRIRQGSVTLLGILEDQDSVDVLIAALGDPDPAVRLASVRAVGRFGTAVGKGSVVDKLISILRSDGADEMRDSCALALVSIAPEQERVALALAEALSKDRSPAVRCTAAAAMKGSSFAFAVPALIAALDDSSPQVRLAAGACLASIGLSDDRTVPALCRAALKADEMTREGIGFNIGLLILELRSDKTPDAQVARRFQSAVNELRTVLETRGAAAREQAIDVLGRVIASYQKSGRSALCEPARAAVVALLARMEDEKEEVPLRIHAMNQWIAIRPMRPPSRSAAPSPHEELNSRALWIAALCRSLRSPTSEIRSRAVEILMDNFRDRGADSSLREAWRKAVPLLAEATVSDDGKVRHGAIMILSLLGPEARDALPTIRSLAQESQDPDVRSAAAEAIKSISCMDDLTAKDSSVRIAATEVLSRLGWRAAPAVPALTATLSDPDIKVRVSAANALSELGQISGEAVPLLVSTLSREADPGVRVAIVEALEAIAPGTPAVLQAHLNALRDVDPAVRKAGADFKKVPADDSVVSALATALGDANDEVRLKVADSLMMVLFSHQEVVPALFKALGNDAQHKTVLAAMRSHFEKTSDSADFSRARGDLPRLRATLGRAIPTLRDALSLRNAELNPVVFGLLGRIVSFSRLSRDGDLRKSVEPALQIYLQGLDENDPSIRDEVIRRIDGIPIRREEIVSALNRFLERTDLSDEVRKNGLRALQAQNTDGGAGDENSQPRGRPS